MNEITGIGFAHEIAIETALSRRRASAISVAAGAVGHAVGLTLRALGRLRSAGLGPDAERLVGRNTGARC